MKKPEAPQLSLIAGILIMVAAIAIVCATIASASSPANRPEGCLIYKVGECPAERTSIPQQQPVEIIETTTTTIDLSFLDQITTTSTAPQRRASAQSAPEPIAPESLDSSKWDRLAQCETGGNWAANTGNGFGGGLQFAHGPRWSTWRSFGGEEFAAHPWEASREQQIEIGERVLASSGWGAWPGCTRKFGWR
jgi:hypothetical protein